MGNHNRVWTIWVEDSRSHAWVKRVPPVLYYCTVLRIHTPGVYFGARERAVPIHPRTNVARWRRYLPRASG